MKDGDIGAAIFLGIMIGGLAVGLLFAGLWQADVNSIRQKAVQKGYAEYKVINNKNGETEFTWKENKEND